MSSQPRLFRIEHVDAEHTAKQVEEVDFSALGLRERQDIQEWVAAHPDILGDDLLIIAKEFNAFDGTNERADLIGVDSEGAVVIIELKRDDSGADVHWQAVKYASYFRGAPAERIVELLADYANVEADKAAEQLRQHMGIEDDDLSGLNRRQRIILASHRFAPEVTSAVLWLNEQAEFSDLITCVTLIPHRDQDALYVQATTLLPVPGTESLEVSVGSPSRGAVVSGKSRGRRRKIEDAVTHFMRNVDERVLEKLDPVLHPDKRSGWAPVTKWADGNEYRYYSLWYSNWPGANRTMSFEIVLPYSDNKLRSAETSLKFHGRKPGLRKAEQLEKNHFSELAERLKVIGTNLEDELEIQHYAYNNKGDIGMGFKIPTPEELEHEPFREMIVTCMISLIGAVKPAIDDLLEEWNER